MDNPGMRELQLWGDEEDLQEAFEDIEELSSRCRFNDCQHENEPGCAVKEALEEGALERKRYQSYLKLKKELLYLEERRYQSSHMIHREKRKQIAKWAREHKKVSPKC